MFIDFIEFTKRRFRNIINLATSMISIPITHYVNRFTLLLIAIDRNRLPRRNGSLFLNEVANSILAVVV